MKHANLQGQSLIEVLFAISVFTIGVVTIGYLIFDSFTSLALREDALRARLYAQEGLEVAHLLSGSSFDALPQGTYGLEYSDETWMLADSPEHRGKFTRTLSVIDHDAGLKEVRAAVFWESYGAGHSATLATYISNWRGNHGEAKDVSIDVNNANLSASSTVLGGIAPLNTGVEDVTIVGIALQWESSAALTGVSIRNTPVFTSLSSKIASGEYIDIDDYALGAVTGYHLIDFTFDDPINDTDVLLTLIFSDATERHVIINLIP